MSRTRGNRALRQETLDFFLEQAPIMGDIAMSHFENLRDEDVKDKPGRLHDPVTIADTEIRDHIVPAVEKAYRDRVVLLTEESVKGFGYTQADLMKMRKPILIIDEIDGTRNFSQRNEDFTVMLGLAEHSSLGFEMTAGCVYHPPSGEFYLATIDTDAKHRAPNGDERTLRVSHREKMITGITPISAEIAREVWPPNYPGEYCKVGGTMERFSNANARQVRENNRFSCGLEILDVARGDVDIFMVANAGNWDYAAPSLILRQAGGVAYLAKSEGMLTTPHRWSLQLSQPGEYYPAFLTNGAIDEDLFKHMEKYTGE